MAPRAAIAIPTRNRSRYLDVALASICPQAAALGAEVVVVDDGPDAATRAVATRHCARYVAHDAPRGINVARNTAVAATDAPLLAFVDDDVEVWDGWLHALLHAAGEQPPEVGVFTGPIRPRIEDHRYRSCGREGPPITFLDLGPDDVDAARAWGANMAIRRAALERVGPFAEHLVNGGDEEEWQARWQGLGGGGPDVAAARGGPPRRRGGALAGARRARPVRRGRRARPPPRRRRRAPALARSRRVPPRPRRPAVRRARRRRAVARGR